MSSVWFINLERRVKRSEFDIACEEIGIDFSDGNTYYDIRYEAERYEKEYAKKRGLKMSQVSKILEGFNGIGRGLILGNLGVEIDFGGIRQVKENNPYATQITVRSLLEKGRYEAMKKTTCDLSRRIPFKSIFGEWFDDVSRKPLPYSTDVYKEIEKEYQFTLI